MEPPTDTVLLYADGDSHVVIVHPDPQKPVLFVGPSVDEGTLDGDLRVLWEDGVHDCQDGIRERGGKVNRPDKSQRGWRPPDTWTPIAKWTPDGGLWPTGWTATMRHYAGRSNSVVRAKMSTDPVGLMAMARRIGVSQSTISNWGYRPDFPRPRLESPRQWHWPDIVDWLLDHPNLRGVQAWIVNTYGNLNGPTEENTDG